MTEKTERLSLGEIEALARDALMRLGVQEAAASATAWAIRASERSGDRASGLERMPRLLEGLKTSSISATSRPILAREPTAVLRVDAAHGLSDAAISEGFETLTELVRSYGMALLTVTATGDVPAPRPWIDQLAERRILGMSLGGMPESGIAFSEQGVSSGFSPDILPSVVCARMLRAVTGKVARAPIPDHLPPVEPADGSICLIAIAQARHAAPSDPTSDGGSVMDDGLALRTRRDQADAEGVGVPSELLVRILTA